MLHYILQQIPKYRHHTTAVLPSTLDELVVWLRGDGAANTGYATPVTEWLSRDELITFDSPNYPTYYTAGNNSRPTVSFTTDDYVFNLNAFFESIGGSIFVVFNVDGTGTYSLLSQTDISAVHRSFAIRVVNGYLNIIQENDGVEVSLTGDTALGTGWHIATVHSNGTGILDRGLSSRCGGSFPMSGNNIYIERLSARIDGVDQVLTQDATTGWFGTPSVNEMRVGANATGTANYLDGDVQHVIVCKPRLTTSQQDLIETYLARYSNIVL